MSYEIIYNRQFIKVDNESVIPFLEMGSSNCYEASGNGRKRARSWGNSYTFTDGIIVKNTDLLDAIDKFEEQTKLNCIENTKRYGKGWDYDANKFGYHVGVSFYGKTTRSTSFSAFRTYYSNAIKKALTIEELWELGGIRITLSVYRWRDEDITNKNLEIKPNVTFLSTEHMVQTIKEYSEYYKGQVSLYLNCNYDLGMQRMQKRINQNDRANKAIHCKGKEKVEVNEYYVLANDEGNFFVRQTARGYKYSYYHFNGSVKAFITEKEANKFHDRMRNKDLFKVKKIVGNRTFLK